MKKIPTIFEREVTGKKAFAINKWNEECLWVRDGEGVATRKWDGSACLIRDGKLYKRLEWSEGKGPAPKGWLHHSFDPAALSGHGWFPVGDGPDDRWHREAPHPGHDGTFELVGPKVNGNKDRFEAHTLVAHGYLQCNDIPRDFDGIKAWLAEHELEGVVWHHPDGRMAKIKWRDFGLKW